MKGLNLNTDEMEHLKVVVQEDLAKRLQSIRQGGSSVYVTDEVMRERIVKYQKSLDLYNKLTNEQKQEDSIPQSQTNDLFRI